MTFADEMASIREQAEEAERSGGHLVEVHSRNLIGLLNVLSKGANFQLESRSAEALDAERYRYLRNAAGQYLGDEDGPTVCSGLSDLFAYHFGPEVDEVVDAAIARWKAAGCPLPKEIKKALMTEAPK